MLPGGRLCEPPLKAGVVPYYFAKPPPSCLSSGSVWSGRRVLGFCAFAVAAIECAVHHAQATAAALADSPASFEVFHVGRI